MSSDISPIERACAYLDSIKEMLRAKNIAYGNSMFEPLGVFSKLSPEEGLRVRIDDKLKRIMMGNGSGEEDAIGDAIGYLAALHGEIEDRKVWTGSGKPTWKGQL